MSRPVRLSDWKLEQANVCSEGIVVLPDWRLTGTVFAGSHASQGMAW